MPHKNDPLNQEFVRLLANSRWSQAEAARKLRLKDGTISQYVNGLTRPSETVLIAFKCLVGDTLPLPGETTGFVMKESVPRMEEWEQHLFTDLRELDDAARTEVVKHFRGLTALMRKREVSYRRSAVESGEAAARKAASAALGKLRKGGV